MRKLSRAALELLDGKKIIDISIEYGFETHGGFAKAFRKQFGRYPTQADSVITFEAIALKNPKVKSN